MPALPNERQYRALAVMMQPKEERSERRFDCDCYVEGYASTFNDKYELWRDWDGNRYFEIISPDAFADTDMGDVIMQYDHSGQVFARMSNGTLLVEPDEHGLFVAANLDSTTLSRQLYEQIESGLVVAMSWAFTVKESAYDRDERTTTITKVEKIYDVSAVSYPADPNTEISARNAISAADGAIAAQLRAEYAKRKRAVMRAKAQLAINRQIRS